MHFPRRHRTGEIVVSFADRRLYHVVAPGRAMSYPIGVPRAEARWQGALRVSRKRVNPSWTPTASMLRDNPKLPSFVPGGHPRNPMGVRALYLGSTLYRIHGTDAPWTIGKKVSRGCVRMHNAHVIELYKKRPRRRQGAGDMESLPSAARSADATTISRTVGRRTDSLPSFTKVEIERCQNQRTGAVAARRRWQPTDGQSDAAGPRA